MTVHEHETERKALSAESIACPLCRVYWETRHTFLLLRANMRAIRGQRRRGERKGGAIPESLWISLGESTKSLQRAAVVMLGDHLRCAECGILLGVGHGEDYWRRDDGSTVCCECEEGPTARVHACP